MMPPDPRFPDRPTHADFEILSEQVWINDIDSEVVDDGFLHRVAEFCDIDSISYVVMQRAMLMGARRPDDIARIAGAMMDGFMLGCAFMRAKDTKSE